MARGSGTQAPYPMAFGACGGGPGDTLSNFNLRSDFDLEAIWELREPGLGQPRMIRERQADFDRACVEASRARDIVAKEVTQHWAALQSASHRTVESPAGVAAGIDLRPRECRIWEQPSVSATSASWSSARWKRSWLCRP